MHSPIIYLEGKMKQKHSWEITDEFWTIAEPLVPKKTRGYDKEYQRKPGGGRRPMEPRTALAAIFFVLRTGIQWKALPKCFGSSSAVHRYFMFWSKAGFFKALWVRGLRKYDEVKGINWEWLSGDGCMTKAPLAQETVGANPTDRGKKREQAAPARRRHRSTACLGSNRSKQA
jgi:transposase